MKKIYNISLLIIFLNLTNSYGLVIYSTIDKFSDNKDSNTGTGTINDIGEHHDIIADYSLTTNISDSNNWSNIAIFPNNGTSNTSGISYSANNKNLVPPVLPQTLEMNFKVDNIVDNNPATSIWSNPQVKNITVSQWDDELSDYSTFVNHSPQIIFTWIGGGSATIYDPNNQIQGHVTGDTITSGQSIVFNNFLIYNSNASWSVVMPDNIPEIKVEYSYNNSSYRYNEHIHFDVTLVPEPTSTLLIMTSSIFFLLLRRRQG